MRSGERGAFVVFHDRLGRFSEAAAGAAGSTARAQQRANATKARQPADSLAKGTEAVSFFVLRRRSRCGTDVIIATRSLPWGHGRGAIFGRALLDGVTHFIFTTFDRSFSDRLESPASEELIGEL
jgi:hypothetical protein